MIFGKYRLRRMLKKSKHRIFDYDVPIIALSYGLTEFQVHQIMAEVGYYSQRYVDRFCSCNYYILSEDQVLKPLEIASSYADENGTILISDCHFYEEEDGGKKPK